LEELAKERAIDLFYGDESQVSLLPCIPYGWQFADEEIAMPSERGAAVNCFALLKRENDGLFATTSGKITAAFIFEQLESLSIGLKKPTVVVLDNARVHSAKLVRERIEAWQARGLFIFYLPAYSPHLNIVETLWRRAQIRMAVARTLQNERDALLFRQTSTSRRRHQFEDTLFGLQEYINLILFEYLIRITDL
jgi:transposase